MYMYVCLCMLLFRKGNYLHVYVCMCMYVCVLCMYLHVFYFDSQNAKYEIDLGVNEQLGRSVHVFACICMYIHVHVCHSMCMHLYI